MKTIAIHLDDELYQKIIKLKGKRTWLQFLNAIVQQKI